MSRKRDTNWTRDEITVLLDSIMEITQGQGDGGTRRTNSREVFEYAAKKLGEKGHAARAEREKCRTKWKKMKEEFNHAKRARETGEGRIAPGIEPFYSRMLEFINGSFDNISPHSTIVRRSSSISSNNNHNHNNNNNNINNNNNNNNNNTSSNNNSNRNNIINITKNGNNSNNHNSNSSGGSTTASNNNGIVTISNNNHNGSDGVHHSSNNPTNSSRFSQGASRASARIAANSNGVSSNDASDTSSTIATRQNNVEGSNYSTAALTFPLSDSSLISSRQIQRPSPVDMNGSNTSMTLMSAVTNRSHLSSSSLNGSADLSNHRESSPGEQMKITVDCDSVSRNENPSTQNPNNYSASINNNTLSNNHNNSGSLNNSNDLTNQLQPAERDADISYRVSTGCRQITIFGDHDVDIKFRGDCVTINKIGAAYSTSTPGTMNNSDT